MTLLPCELHIFVVDAALVPTFVCIQHCLPLGPNGDASLFYFLGCRPGYAMGLGHVSMTMITFLRILA